MIQEMEGAIIKRDQIATRFKGRSNASKERTKTRGYVQEWGGAKSTSAGCERGDGLGDLTTTTLKKKAWETPKFVAVAALCTKQVFVILWNFYIHVNVI